MPQPLTQNLLGPSRAVLFDDEAEQAVLGSLFINPMCYHAVRAIVRPADFYLIKNRWVFDAVESLTQAGTPVDVLTVSKHLESRSQLDELGGVAYITQLLNTVPTSLHAEAYAEIVKRNATRRNLLEAATQIAKLAYDEARPIADVVSAARAEVRGVEVGGQHGTLRRASEWMNAVYAEFDDPEALTRTLIPTGYEDLDKIFGGGLERQTSTMVEGRPGMGKTAWMTQTAYQMAEAGKVVAFFSKEMSAKQILRRMACQAAGVSWQEHKAGKTPDDKLPELVHHIDHLRRLGERGFLLIDESPRQTTEEVLRELERMADEGIAVDVFMVDHLRLLADKERNDNEVARLGRISWAFKQMTRELNCVGIVAAQVNRGLEGRQNKRPMLSDLRGSGEIEENADNVIGLFRPAYYALEQARENGQAPPQMPDTGEMWVLKQREGMVNAMAEFVFDAPATRFLAAVKIALNDTAPAPSPPNPPRQTWGAKAQGRSRGVERRSFEPEPVTPWWEKDDGYPE